MSDQSVREHGFDLLKGCGAHLGFEQAIAGLPEELRGGKVDGVPHTPWRLLEHMRICQWDILELWRNSDHVSPDFPDGYWPKEDAPSNSASWDQSVKHLCSDLQAMIDLIANPGTDLHAPIPHGYGQTHLAGGITRGRPQRLPSGPACSPTSMLAVPHLLTICRCRLLQCRPKRSVLLRVPPCCLWKLVNNAP